MKPFPLTQTIDLAELTSFQQEFQKRSLSKHLWIVYFEVECGGKRTGLWTEAEFLANLEASEYANTDPVSSFPGVHLNTLCNISSNALTGEVLAY